MPPIFSQNEIQSSPIFQSVAIFLRQAPFYDPPMGTRVKTRTGQARRPHFIREWRKHREMTQAELADAIGVATSSISQLERGDQGYSQATLEALAEALGCSPADLLARNPQHLESTFWTQDIWSLNKSLRPK